MSQVEDLITARDATLVKYNAVIALAEDKPSYSVDGRSFSWNEYSDSLLAKYEKLQQLVINASNSEVQTHILG